MQEIAGFCGLRVTELRPKRLTPAAFRPVVKHFPNMERSRLLRRVVSGLLKDP